MKSLFIVNILIVFAIVINGCEFSQQTSAYFEIINKSVGVESGMHYFDLTVKNTGGETGKNVICNVIIKELKKREIVGSSSTIFNEGQNIPPGSIYKSRAIFAEPGVLEAEGVLYTYELTWVDIEGTLKSSSLNEGTDSGNLYGVTGT